MEVQKSNWHRCSRGHLMLTYLMLRNEEAVMDYYDCL